MLLLIMTKEEIKDLYSNSNTSHVTINLACYHPILPIERHSNTSHVTINPYNHFRYGLRRYIQIHLMLLLIAV